MSDALAIRLDSALVNAIAERAVEMLREQPQLTADPWLTVEQAADYIGAKPQRVYDLRRAGRLPKTGDGSRALIRRSALDAYLERSG